MIRKTFFTPVALAALLALGALPAAADEHADHARARGQSSRTQSDERRAPQARSTVTRGYAVPRAEHVAPRYYAAPGYYTTPRYYATPRYSAAAHYYPVPRYYAAPRIYVPRPYYPGFSVGIFFGTPYPYRWAYPVYVPVPYGYPAYSVPPGVAYGGISFGGLTPYDASVFVDGSYVGVASTFDGRRQPLTLAAGRHRIELQAPGYAPIAFDIDVVPGQVIPYQGGLPGNGY
jgi:hypothetical protein